MMTITVFLVAFHYAQPFPRIGHILQKSSSLETRSLVLSRLSNQVENGVDLTFLQNVDEDSNFLGSSICSWLDNEYIKQSIHADIGKKVSEIYYEERSQGTTDLGQMLMRVGTVLESFDMGDAFVNAWDVANKVSDLLMVRMDRELCSCAGDMSAYSNTQPKDLDDKLNLMNNPSTGDLLTNAIPPIQLSSAVLQREAVDLRPTFERYLFLREFLEGDVYWDRMHIAIALVLGFRTHNNEDRVVHNASLAPHGWESLVSVPSFSDGTDDLVTSRLTEDLPEDVGAMDIMMESVAGIEGYKMLKKEAITDQDVERRLLVTQWMYVNGFLIDDFPSTISFIPGHVQR